DRERLPSAPRGGDPLPDRRGPRRRPGDHDGLRRRMDARRRRPRGDRAGRMRDALARAEVMIREACGERLRTAFPLAPLTTFRIGGPASLYLELASDRDLEAVGDAVRRTDVPVLVIGKGSNLLIADRGFAGIALRLGRTF